MTRSDWLLRLFPRNWRARYGAEFAALLETSFLTPRNILGIVRLAAGEWLLRTMPGRVLLGLTVSSVALWCAMMISAAIPVAPVITFEGGRQLVAPPGFRLLGQMFGVVVFASIFRFVIRTFGVVRSPAPMSARGLSVWLLALFFSSVFAQWVDLIGWHGPRLEPTWPFSIWGHQAVYTTIALINLLAADRHSRLESANTRTAKASRPLGLS
jgi:hypothetical protein